MGELWRSINIKQSYGDLPSNGQNRIKFWTNTRRNDLIVTGFFFPPLSYFPFTSRESKESNFGPFPKLGQILVSKWRVGRGKPRWKWRNQFWRLTAVIAVGKHRSQYSHRNSKEMLLEYPTNIVGKTNIYIAATNTICNTVTHKCYFHKFEYIYILLQMRLSMVFHLFRCLSSPLESNACNTLRNIWEEVFLTRQKQNKNQICKAAVTWFN